jgi:hypothetical protein
MTLIHTVIRYSDRAEMLAKIQHLGATVTEGYEDMPEEYAFPWNNTPELLCANGDRVFCVRLPEEEADKLNVLTSPTFLVDWRSDETETVIETTEDGTVEVERQLPWPEYEISYQLEDGTTVTTLQGCGRFAG